MPSLSVIVLNRYILDSIQPANLPCEWVRHPRHTASKRLYDSSLIPTADRQTTISICDSAGSMCIQPMGPVENASHGLVRTMQIMV
jgi:hypothetical protein